MVMRYRPSTAEKDFWTVYGFFSVFFLLVANLLPTFLFPGLFRRNIHGVSKEKISRMLEHYQRFVSVPIIMSSSDPEKTERIELCAYACEDRNSRWVKVYFMQKLQCEAMVSFLMIALKT